MTETADAVRAMRAEAVRELEEEFAVLLDHIRRLVAERAERVSPGLLPGAYKVFTTIARHDEITLSTLAEVMMADKGQLSRTVRELEELRLVSRAADPHDRRSSLISATPEGLQKLQAARAPSDGALLSAVTEWPVEDIRQLSRLLNALTAVTPAD